MSKSLSAVKRVQTSSRNNLRNKKYKSSIKTIIKKTLESIAIINQSNDITLVKSFLSKSYSRIDKAIKKGIIPKNQGARKKAMIYKKVKKYYFLNNSNFE
uniref:Ribosomal protein S20 n=1 Tax=Synarthrophyton chejuense TaxID=2485825 RepID=A0A3G3MFG9_9FLOR|nr:ribosomal protein S20 [Synarthrophyton chejuense]AYR05570.1 ribosomal protein S20 [Synarthrophyton chejuense]